MIEKSAQPSDRELHDAYDHFRTLLSRRTLERDWQQFFHNSPFVLSRSLPLRLDPREIIARATPGKSEADFIFYQRIGGTVSAYGTIELKRPDSRILTFPRKDVVLLTRDADTAIKQAEKYAKSIMLPNDTLFLGCSQYLFVIMGLSSELTHAFAKDIAQAQFNRLLPERCQLLPYDILLRRFESTLPAHCIVLVPTLPTDEEIVSSMQATDTLQRDAIQRLFSDEAFFRKLRTIALRTLARGGGHTYLTAEDIVQETFLRLWTHPPKTDNIWPWLSAVVRNVARDYRRRAYLMPYEELSETLAKQVRHLSAPINRDQKVVLTASPRVETRQGKFPRRANRRKTP